MKKPRKYSELIKAWADGADIESRYKFTSSIWGVWREDDFPDWHDDWEYRIKSETVPDIVKFYRSIDCELLHTHFPSEASISITWDGESKTIKSLDFIKC